jgi:hypothetical protein
VPSGDPVDGIGIVRYADAVSGQLVTKSYRPRTGNHRGSVHCHDPLSQLLGPVDGRLPDPLALSRIEGGEDLAPPAVQHGQARAGLRLPDSVGEGVEGADAPHRQPEADAQPLGGGDADAQPGEGPGAEADREQLDRVPAAGRRGRPLDLVEQAGRMEGPPLWGEPQLRLMQDLAVAPGAGDGVDRRGIEADDDQKFVIR